MAKKNERSSNKMQAKLKLRFFFWLIFALSMAVIFYFVLIECNPPIETPTPTPTASITQTATATRTAFKTATGTNTPIPTIKPITATFTAIATKPATRAPTQTPTLVPVVGGCNCNQNAEEYYKEYPGCAGRCSWSKDN